MRRTDGEAGAAGRSERAGSGAGRDARLMATTLLAAWAVGARAVAAMVMAGAVGANLR